jgi:uncharacterized membrane protein HdeD (DUF308 family)
MADDRSNTPMATPPGYGRVPKDQLTDPHPSLRSNWGWMVALGIALLLGGTAALILPFVATVTVTLLVGISMLIGGIFQLVQVFDAEGWRGRIWAGIAGLVFLAGWVLLLVQPLAGIVAVTLVMIVAFLLDGIMRLVMGFRIRPERGWGWIAASGVIGIVAAGVMLMLMPEATASLLGVLAGIALIFEGWSLIFLGVAIRRVARRDEPMEA